MARPDQIVCLRLGRDLAGSDKRRITHASVGFNVSRPDPWIVVLHFRNGDVGPGSIKYTPVSRFLKTLNVIRHALSAHASTPGASPLPGGRKISLVVLSEAQLPLRDMEQLRRALCRPQWDCAAESACRGDANCAFNLMVNCGQVLVIGNSGFSMLASVLRPSGLVVGVGAYRTHYNDTPSHFGDTAYVRVGKGEVQGLKRSTVKQIHSAINKTWGRE